MPLNLSKHVIKYFLYLNEYQYHSKVDYIEGGSVCRLSFNIFDKKMIYSTFMSVVPAKSMSTNWRRGWILTF